MDLKPLSFAVALLGANFGVAPWTASAASAESGTCVGDCGGDGEVTINEVIIGVNIAMVFCRWGAAPHSIPAATVK